MSNCCGKRSFLNKELKAKIDIEVRFTYTFIHILSLFYGQYLANQESLDENTFLTLVDSKLAQFREKDIKKIIKELTKAYKNSKETQVLKNIFTSILHRNIVYTHAMSINIVRGLENKDALSEKESNAKFIEILTEVGNDHANIMEKIKQINQNSVEKYVIQNLKNSYKKKNYSDIELEYIVKMYLKWMLNRQKLRKNDLFDMFFIGSYSKNILNTIKKNYKSTASYDDIFLVTFDDEITSFMNDNNINCPPIEID